MCNMEPWEGCDGGIEIIRLRPHGRYHPEPASLRAETVACMLAALVVRRILMLERGNSNLAF